MKEPVDETRSSQSQPVGIIRRWENVQIMYNYFSFLFRVILAVMGICFPYPIYRIVLYGSENWALQRRRIEAAEMKLLDLWQAAPFMTTKQMTTYAANYGLQAY